MHHAARAYEGGRRDFDGVVTMASYGRTALHVAIRSGEPLDGVALLGSVDLDATDAHGFTPLYTAAMFGRVDAIDALLSAGASHCIADLGGLTPLHISCEKGEEGAAARLIERGACVDAVDSIGRAPRDWAVAKGHAGVVAIVDSALARRRRDE